MSIAITFYNSHGIIMCADNMINSSFKKENCLVKYNLSQTDQKLFLVDEKYGLSYTGDASIKQYPVSALINEYITFNPVNDMQPSVWLLALAKYFGKEFTDKQNIVFIFSGYYQSQRFVITTNTKEPSIEAVTQTAGLLYSGESQFVSMLVNSDIISFEFDKFTLQDAIDFLRFINKTAARLMHFGQYLPTVSDSCDILAILPNMSYWVEHSTLH